MPDNMTSGNQMDFYNHISGPVAENQTIRVSDTKRPFINWIIQIPDTFDKTGPVLKLLQ